MLVQTVRVSPTPVHLFEVKSYAGIAGHECTDAMAKYQVTQVMRAMHIERRRIDSKNYASSKEAPHIK